MPGVAYTENFNFPLLDDGAGNAGAVMNGVLLDIDSLLGRSIVVNNDVVVCNNDEVVYNNTDANQ